MTSRVPLITQMYEMTILTSILFRLTSYQQPFENLRKNVNSFADNLVGGNNSPGSSSTTTTTTAHRSTTGNRSSGIHPDAQKTAEGVAQGTGALVGKAEQKIDQHKKT